MAKKLNIIFTTFSPWEKGVRLPTNGMIEPMLKFFLPKSKRFVLIDEPHPGSDRVIPLIETYSKGKLTKRFSSSFMVSWLYPFLVLRNSVGTRIPFKIRDFLASIDYYLQNKSRFDLFIGLESVNAIAGILLKKLGAVKKVVYYVSDYSPKRYKTGWFNKTYLALDKYAATYADYIWDVSLAMMPERIKQGLDKKNTAKVIHVPNALYPEQINYLPTEKTEAFSLVFAGTLGTENGPDIAIESLKLVTKKFPGAKLHIYGGGESDLTRLEKLTKRLSLRGSVVFHGFMTDQIALAGEIRKYRIGLAPYKAIKGSPRWWADATKIRLYLAAGLPVVTSQVPPLGKELIQTNAGIVTKDNPRETAAAIIRLFSNQNLYKTLRRNAIKKARNNTWENTYSQALDKMSL